jgi:ribosomal protein L37E
VSSRIRCQRCASSHYSASAAAMVARGERCAACGGPLELSAEPQWQAAPRRKRRAAELPGDQGPRPSTGG